MISLIILTIVRAFTNMRNVNDVIADVIDADF